MANVDVISASPATLAPATAATAPLLVSLAPQTTDQLALTLHHVEEALSGLPAIVVSPDVDTAETARSGLTFLPFADSRASRSSWVLSAHDFHAAYRLAKTHGASNLLILGPEAHTLEPEAIRSLSQTVHIGNADLCVPVYTLGAHEGLVNSAMLYPLTRALYGTPIRFPLAVDLALSLRMAERLSAAADRATAGGDDAALLWPVAEAAVAAFKTAQVPAGPRTLPTPEGADLNSLLAHVAGSFFGDIESKAATWQRSRPAQPAATTTHAHATPTEPSDVQSLLDNFRVAYTNLSEIWSLVLPPQSLLGLKKLSTLPTTSFRLPPALWARILYDFVLAFRLRTLNRGHLLGALTPLYLAWVASHLLALDQRVAADSLVEQTALACEAEKPYFVSRWRWPDRFNP